MIRSTVTIAALLLLAGCGGGEKGDVAQNRDRVLAVGSSTVYPFTQAVAQNFRQKHPQFAAPNLQSSGTSAGFEQFCAGVGTQHPDIADASRRIRSAELQACRRNGVNRIVELQIGVDGVAFAQSPAGPAINFNAREVYEALAAEPYGQPNAKRSWKEINSALPDIPILFYGPPATSGTRDALAELILMRGCESKAEMQAMKASDPARFARICTSIRKDGVYVEAGEDDRRMTQMAVVNPGAVGIFGYSFLNDNADKLRGLAVDGVAPTEENIASFRYPGARPLYVYVKGEHLDLIPGLKQFVAEYAGAIGPDGYLAQRGLVPAPEPVRARTVRIAANLTPLNPTSVD